MKTRPVPRKKKKRSFKLPKSALKIQTETEILLENMFDFLTASLKKKPQNTLVSYVTLRNGGFFSHSCHIVSPILLHPTVLV